MSKENLDRFMSRIAGSDELQAKNGDEISVETMIALGAEEGIDFRAEECGESDELTDDNLEAVAGEFIVQTGKNIGRYGISDEPAFAPRGWYSISDEPPFAGGSVKVKGLAAGSHHAAWLTA